MKLSGEYFEALRGLSQRIRNVLSALIGAACLFSASNSFAIDNITFPDYSTGVPASFPTATSRLVDDPDKPYNYSFSPATFCDKTLNPAFNPILCVGLENQKGATEVVVRFKKPYPKVVVTAKIMPSLGALNNAIPNYRWRH